MVTLKSLRPTASPRKIERFWTLPLSFTAVAADKLYFPFAIRPREIAKSRRYSQSEVNANIISAPSKGEIDRVNRGVGGHHARPRDFHSRPRRSRCEREEENARGCREIMKNQRIALACHALSSDRSFENSIETRAPKYSKKWMYAYARSVPIWHFRTAFFGYSRIHAN